jgi:quercetin dioxygenase-like cupin family protein
MLVRHLEPRMPLYRLDALTTRELFPGFTARLVHTPRLTQSFVDATEGSTFPEHQHPHEQIVTVLDGELELVVQGEPHRLTAGTTFVIPPEVPHHGRALTNCRVLDTFAPTREDYR